MKERPILFSGPMVRAILAGTKTQTRRIVKPQPYKIWPISGGLVASGSKADYETNWDGVSKFSGKSPYPDRRILSCPYGQPGDRLWTQEQYFINGWEWEDVNDGGSATIILQGEYPSDDSDFMVTLDREESGKFYLRKRRGGGSPGRFMYRSLSRLLLEITGIRVERLNDIAGADAKAEGIEVFSDGLYRDYSEPLAASTADDPRSGMCFDAVESYASLWESINGPGSWELNPWAWVVEFKRLEAAS